MRSRGADPADERDHRDEVHDRHGEHPEAEQPQHPPGRHRPDLGQVVLLGHASPPLLEAPAEQAARSSRSRPVPRPSHDRVGRSGSLHSPPTAFPLAADRKLTHGAGMSIDEQRGYARPDARDADGPEVIGEAPIAEDDVDSRPGEPTAPLGAGVQASTSDPQPVVWPPAANGAPTQPMSPANQPNPTLQHPVQPSPYGRPADEAAGSPTAVVETDPWAQPPNDPWLDVTPGSSGVETVGAAPQSRGRRLAGAVGLFAAGAVVGGLVTGAYTGWGSNDAPAPASQPGQVQGQAGQPGGQAPGRLGGPAGGQDQQGTAP